MHGRCIGREASLAQIGAAFELGRWITLTGPPGVGKTLVARAVARAEDDAVWVDATERQSRGHILDAIRESLGLQVVPGEATEQTISRAMLGDARLIVIDGVGTEVHGLGLILHGILQRTASFRLLVTSVESAGLPQERVIKIRPLPTPRDAESYGGPAARLLEERIVAAGGDGIRAADRARAVTLLLSTAGLPLLIEQLAVQIATVGIDNVQPLPRLGDSLQASYALLSPRAQLGYRRLAQLSGPIGLWPLSEVLELPRAEAAEVMGTLVARSLVEVTPSRKFDMLQPIRAHGRSLSSATDDAVLARNGLIRWADRVARAVDTEGAADEPWLKDLATMRQAIALAAADPTTRATAYRLANRVFSPLYTAMLTAEAAEILGSVVRSGDGPPDIGSQVARRAAVTISELRGTYEGLELLARADAQAESSPSPRLERARTASIRAEMHLDAANLQAAREEALKALDIAEGDAYLVRQIRRTLADIAVAQGDLDRAVRLCRDIMTGAAKDERWMVVSGQLLLARIALERGRPLEAEAGAKAALEAARSMAELRMAMHAGVLMRVMDASVPADDTPRDSLPWSVQIYVRLVDARDLWVKGELEAAAAAAADLLALAESAQIGREAVDARLLLGHILCDLEDLPQARAVYLSALTAASRFGLPLRVADALDALAYVGGHRGAPDPRPCAAAARDLRLPRQARPWGVAAQRLVDSSGVLCPPGWVEEGVFTEAGLEGVLAMCSGVALAPGSTLPGGTSEGTEGASSLSTLTKAEWAVARLVSEGLTSRQIAEQLFISPRTVDAHLSHIFRKLGISGRARLAALIAESQRQPGVSRATPS